MLEPTNALVDLTEYRQDRKLVVQPQAGRGRPKRNGGDALADARNDDVAFLENLDLRIRKNMLTGDIEYKHPERGLQCIGGDDLTIFTHMVAEHFGETLVEGAMKNALLYVADKHRFHPVVEYLEGCATKEPSPLFSTLASTFFGNDEAVANQGLQRFLVGLVARAYNPGAPLSYLPVLQGGQGVGKSRWCRELVPDGLFAELSSGLDTLIKEAYRLHVGWLLEIPEVDRHFTSLASENLKNLVTIRTDEIRRPYQQPTKAPRGFGLIGTTNQDTFLCDATGNRRFIPIAIKVCEIDVELLQRERDAIWAAAVQAYRAGQSWEFSTGELAALSDYQSDFMEIDAWADTILSSVSKSKEVTTANILLNTIGVGLDKQNTSHRRRVAAVMKGAGWKQLNTTRQGRKVRLWVNPDPTVAIPLGDF